MNSPHINHNTREFKTIIGLIIIIILIEITVRSFEERLSGNIKHIYSIASITSKISNNNSSLVFLGNSLTNNAIDLNLIESSINSINNQTIQALKITPDGTALADWYCIYQNKIHSGSNHPSTIAIGFAWGLLSDQQPINPTRLGGFFCNADDISHLDDTGLTNHREILRFLAGSMSHVYVNREAIRNKVLESLIPHYKTITQNINQQENDNHNTVQDEKNQYTYSLLTKLINSIKSTGNKVILIAMPVIEPYHLDDKLLEATNNLNVPLLDLRNTRAISNDMFKDGIHLNSIGGTKFSIQLAKLISPYLNKTSDGYQQTSRGH